MTLERKIAGVFALDDETWLRHANPWSVLLRNTVLPLLIVAVWSRLWLGWYALVPLAVALLWTWYNPRLFPAPASFDYWASKAVLGERVWLNRDVVPVPARHRTVPNILSAVSGIGMLFVFWGALVFDVWPTIFGMALIYAGKLWFLDRMAWLWEDMKDNPAYTRLTGSPRCCFPEGGNNQIPGFLQVLFTDLPPTDNQEKDCEDKEEQEEGKPVEDRNIDGYSLRRDEKSCNK